MKNQVDTLTLATLNWYTLIWLMSMNEWETLLVSVTIILVTVSSYDTLLLVLFMTWNAISGITHLFSKTRAKMKLGFLFSSWKVTGGVDNKVGVISSKNFIQDPRLEKEVSKVLNITLLTHTIVSEQFMRWFFPFICSRKNRLKSEMQTVIDCETRQGSRLHQLMRKE